MKLYIVLEYNPFSFSKVLGVFTSEENAKECYEKDWNVWKNEPRKIITTTINNNKIFKEKEKEK